MFIIVNKAESNNPPERLADSRFRREGYIKTLPLAREPEGGFSISSKHSYQGREFYVIIYHPSRFASLIHLNILIYRYLNSVTDTSKTEKSITLSITIWGYPSRFSHYTLPNTAYNRWYTCDGWQSGKSTWIINKF